MAESKYTINLSAPATLTATLGAGKINVNDYTLAVEEVENGVKLTLTRGSKTETVFIPDGAKGEKGDKGDKGDKGEQGPKGDPGSDANVTADNIEAALGYTPVKPTALDAKQDVLTDADKQAITKIGMTSGAAWASAEQSAGRARLGLNTLIAYVTPEMYTTSLDIADWTNAIQQAVNSGKKVVLTGEYRISAAIEIGSNTIIDGSNTATIIAKLNDTTGVNCFAISDGAHDVTIKNIKLTGVKTNASKAIVGNGSNYRLKFTGVTIDSFNYGMRFNYAWTCYFDKCLINNCSYCVNLNSSADGTVASFSFSFSNCIFTNSNYGIQATSASTNMCVSACTFATCVRCFDASSTIELNIFSCGFEEYTNIIVARGSGILNFVGGHVWLTNDVTEDFAITSAKTTCVGVNFREGFKASGVAPVCINCLNEPTNSKTVVLN